MQISIQGVDRALKIVEKYADLQEKCMEFAYRLCEVGMPVADGVFGNHASIVAERSPSGARIIIDGDEVLFIEFGTGNATGIYRALYDEVPVVVEPGSWSEAHGGEYWKTGGYPNGYWHFNGQKIQETEPIPGTYYAYREMVQAIPQVASEVFR